MNNKLDGYQLAGTSRNRAAVKGEFYATPPASVRALLSVEEIIYPVLEPACGMGHISMELGAGGEVISTDLFDRGFGMCGVNFLTHDFSGYGKINTIITNPPFSLFKEFAEIGLDIAKRKVILFGKLQALEGQKRASFLEKSPLKTVYVFKSRQNPMRDGSNVNELGKPWQTTMAFAWFVWEVGYNSDPIIKWL